MVPRTSAAASQAPASITAAVVAEGLTFAARVAAEVDRRAPVVAAGVDLAARLSTLG